MTCVWDRPKLLVHDVDSADQSLTNGNSLGFIETAMRRIVGSAGSYFVSTLQDVNMANQIQTVDPSKFLRKNRGLSMTRCDLWSVEKGWGPRLGWKRRPLRESAKTGPRSRAWRCLADRSLERLERSYLQADRNPYACVELGQTWHSACVWDLGLECKVEPWHPGASYKLSSRASSQNRTDDKLRFDLNSVDLNSVM